MSPTAVASVKAAYDELFECQKKVDDAWDKITAAENFTGKRVPFDSPLRDRATQASADLRDALARLTVRTAEAVLSH